MKFHTAFALLIAAVSTFSGAQANVITDQIVEAIEDVSQSIKDAGLDPLNIKREAAYYELPVPVIFNAGGLCEEVLSTGLSNIIINDIHYDLLRFRLTFDIEMPHIHLSADIVAGEAVIFDNRLTAEVAGSIDIRNIRVKGDFIIGVLGGIGIRSADIDSSIGAIDTDLSVILQSYDVSDAVNTFLGETVLSVFEAFKPEIDELIAILLMDYINENI